MNDDLLDLYEKRVDKYIKEKQKNDDLYDYITRLEERIDKAIRNIEILLEIALEQDSDNVNLIDRLKGILDILKGSDKE